MRVRHMCTALSTLLYRLVILTYTSQLMQMQANLSLLCRPIIAVPYRQSIVHLVQIESLVLESMNENSPMMSLSMFTNVDYQDVGVNTSLLP